MTCDRCGGQCGLPVTVVDIHQTVECAGRQHYHKMLCDDCTTRLQVWWLSPTWAGEVV